MCASNSKDPKKIVAIAVRDFDLFGCPNCGFDQAFTVFVHNQGKGIICCSCEHGFIVTAADAELVNLFNDETIYRRIDHPRRGTPKHTSHVEEPLDFASRGLGSDNIPGCFVCGGEWSGYHNISGFTNNRVNGSAIVDLFDCGARLDYRDFEPDWVQVKIGACDEHKPNLEYLDKLTREANSTITRKIIDLARHL